MAISKYADGIDEALKQWATPIQAKYIDKTNELGSARKAAIQARGGEVIHQRPI